LECWAAGSCAEREEGEVAYLMLVWFVQEDRVVGLYGLISDLGVEIMLCLFTCRHFEEVRYKRSLFVGSLFDFKLLSCCEALLRAGVG